MLSSRYWERFVLTAATILNLPCITLRPAGSATWQLVRGYSSGATYDWNSTGAATGTVYFGVWIKDAASPNTYDAVTNTTVTVT